MLCANCGASIDHSAKFCENCGRPVKQEPASVEGRSELQPPTGRSSRIAVGILAAAVAVAAIGWYQSSTALPSCGSPEAVNLVTKLISDNFLALSPAQKQNVTLTLKMIEKGELTANGNVRKCSARLGLALVTGDAGDVPIHYELKLLDGKPGEFLAEVSDSPHLQSLRPAIVRDALLREEQASARAKAATQAALAEAAGGDSVSATPDVAAGSDSEGEAPAFVFGCGTGCMVTVRLLGSVLELPLSGTFTLHALTGPEQQMTLDNETVRSAVLESSVEGAEFEGGGNRLEEQYYARCAALQLAAAKKDSPPIEWTQLSGDDADFTTSANGRGYFFRALCQQQP